MDVDLEEISKRLSTILENFSLYGTELKELQDSTSSFINGLQKDIELINNYLDHPGFNNKINYLPTNGKINENRLIDDYNLANKETDMREQFKEQYHEQRFGIKSNHEKATLILIKEDTGLFWGYEISPNEFALFPNWSSNLDTINIDMLKRLFDFEGESEKPHSFTIQHPALINQNDGKYTVKSKGKLIFN
jgi:hypothetical protein